MRFPARCLSVLSGAVLVGCAHKFAGPTDSAKPAPPPPAQTLTNTTPPKVGVILNAALVGKVQSVNSAGRFVILNFPIGLMPLLDQHLFVYRGQTRVGEVRVSG